MIFRFRRLADPFDVFHHGESEGIRVDPSKPTIIKVGLRDDRRVHVQEFEHRCLIHLAGLMQTIHDLVMHKRRATFIHQLRLLLWIEVLCGSSNNLQHLSLPVLQLGSV